MRVIILTNNQGNQVALCNKISRECEIAAVVISRNIPRKTPDFSKRVINFFNRLAGRLIGGEFVKVWFEMLEKYDSLYPHLPTEDVINVANINDTETLEIIQKSAPDLIIVSGTNLVGKKIIRLAEKGKGIVNLHTGISPYVKGGPNCTNWCLAEKWFHLIGNTVMWLDAGIDTGKIISTEQTPLDGTENLFELHWKVMEHAHDLYVRAIRSLAEGKEVPSVPQNSIGKGRTFYTADWNSAAMRRALENFKGYYSAYFADTKKQKRLTSELQLVRLSD